MRLREKGAKKGSEPIHMDFGQAQAALQSGAYEAAEDEGAEPGPDISHGVVGDDPSFTDAGTAKNAPRPTEPAAKGK